MTQSNINQIDPYQTPANGKGDTKFCRHCGKKIQIDATICPFCKTPEFKGKPKSKAVAVTLGLLLGFTGAHRLYLGKWWGIFYLFFGVLAWIVAIVESIVFLSMSKTRWDEKYSNVPANNAGMIVAAIFGGVIVLGIVAAIALPAYQDYTLRAKISSSVKALEPIQQKLESYYFENGKHAISFNELEMEPNPDSTILKSIKLNNNGDIILTFLADNTSILDEETLMLVSTPTNNSFKWDCSAGTLPTKYRPVSCRKGRYSKQQGDSSSRLIIDDYKQFQFRVPANWSYRTDLNDEASIQLANLRKEEYLVLFDHLKEDVGNLTLKEYADVLNEDMKLNSSSFRGPKELTINNLNALKYEMSAEVNNMKIDYMVVFIEGERNNYFLMMWTLPSKKSAAWPKFAAIINSFQERY